MRRSEIKCECGSDDGILSLAHGHCEGYAFFCNKCGKKTELGKIIVEYL